MTGVLASEKQQLKRCVFRWETVASFITQHVPSSKRTAKEVLFKAKDLQRNGGCRRVPVYIPTSHVMSSCHSCHTAWSTTRLP